MPRFAEVAAVARGLERWLLPAECLLCLRSVGLDDADSLVCALCRSRWRPLPDPICPRCGQPRGGEIRLDWSDTGPPNGLGGRATEPEACKLCHEWPAALGRVRSAVWLEGRTREAVHHLKYGGWWRLAETMAGAMRGLEPLTGQVSLIPIPLASKRARERGYNQSERLAAALARRLGLSVRLDLLGRLRETRTQTALTPDERRANVAGAFAAGRVSGLRLVVVDDVFTTGATLVGAAEALAAAGAERVEAVTFARAIG
jgi:ComF family protein